MISAYQAFRYDIVITPPPLGPHARSHALLTLAILRYVIEFKCDILTLEKMIMIMTFQVTLFCISYAFKFIIEFEYELLI